MCIWKGWNRDWFDHLGDQLCFWLSSNVAIIDVGFGKQRSIAWIDEKSKCFFPKTFVESTDDESKSLG